MRLEKIRGGHDGIFHRDLSRMVLLSSDERSAFGDAVVEAIRRHHAADKAVQSMGIPLYHTRSLLGECNLLLGSASDGSPAENHLERHVSNVLYQLRDGVSRLNIRGAAIKHFGFIESRILKKEQEEDGGQPNVQLNVQQAEIPIPLVLSYLETLLLQLHFQRQRPVVAHQQSSADSAIGGGSKHPDKESFLGDDNVRPFLVAVGTWLSMQRRAVCPLSIVLAHVKVGHVPWLRECSTKNKKLRSAMQQAIFGAVCIALFRDVLPVLIERSIHISWSPRNPRVFLYYSKVAWDVVCRHEMKAMCQKPQTGRVDLARASSMDVWCRARSSVLGNKLLYASIRLLPDGRKLRPIATIRCGSASALAALAQKRPLYPPPPRLGNAPKPSPRAPPNQTILRKALLCLICGLQEHRRKLGVANIVNSSHVDEYPLLAAFVREARMFAETPILSSSSAQGHHVHLLRADATRCYDRLPQKAVLSTIDSLVAESWYYTARFQTIHRRSPCNVENGEGACLSDLALRVWITTLTESNFSRGHVPNIPQGWIVEECDAPEKISGDDVRRVLHDHCYQHLVVVDHELFVQTAGIIQGSAVAMILCEALLEEVDISLADVLSLYEEPSILLRRVDDVLVGTLSSSAATHAKSRCLDGWSHCGFMCNKDKLVCSNHEPVTWCGLLIDPQTLFVAVDWRRLQAQLAHGGEHVRFHEPGEHDVMVSVLRLIGALQMRMPLTIFCTRINSPRRVAGSLLEAALVLSRYLVEKVLDNELACRQHLRLFLRPLAVAISAMSTHLTRKYEQLDAQDPSLVVQHSASISERMSRRDVAVIFTAALSHTLQAKLRFILHQRRPTPDAPASRWSKRFWFLMAAVLQQKLVSAKEAAAQGEVENRPWIECGSDSLFVQDALEALSRA